MHSKDVGMVAKAVDKFSKDLYGVIKEGEKGNILYSPYSVATLLAMLSEGARGETLKMMRTKMYLPESESLRRGYRDSIAALRTNENFVLDTANTGFVMKDYKLLEEFKTLLHEYYHADFNELDFAENENAARIINDWVKTMTRDKIKKIISPLDLNNKLEGHSYSFTCHVYLWVGSHTRTMILTIKYEENRRPNKHHKLLGSTLPPNSRQDLGAMASSKSVSSQ